MEKVTLIWRSNLELKPLILKTMNVLNEGEEEDGPLRICIFIEKVVNQGGRKLCGGGNLLKYGN